MSWWTFCAAFVPKAIIASHAPLACTTAYEVIADHPELNLYPDQEFGQYHTFRVLVEMAADESGLEARPIGYNDNDSACGPLQLHELWWNGHSCEDLRSSLKLGLETGLLAIHRLKFEMGFRTTFKALCAFAAGMAWKQPKVQSKIQVRCDHAGGC